MIKSKVIEYFSIAENKLVQYLTFDFTRTNDLVFLADMSQNAAKPHMLLKHKSKYSIIKNNDDLNNLDKIRSYSFNQTIKQLTGKGIQFFEFSLSRQYILEDKGINKM